uniref:hypothetical protein n=1 Tax=Lacticaseibacillus camelliae TaxID=381742 RepID=UPI000A613697
SGKCPAAPRPAGVLPAQRFVLQPYQVVDLGVAYDTMARNGRFEPRQFDLLMRGYTSWFYPWYGSKIIHK